VLQNNKQMESLDIEVLTLRGEKLSLKGDLDKVVDALKEDGCLLLRRATDLSAIAPILSNNQNSLAYVRRDIVLNKVNLAVHLKVQTNSLQAVKTILFASQNDDFRITGYMPYRFGVQRGSAGRDSMWERMAKDIGLVGACCTHLEGDENISWIIEVYEDYRKKANDQIVTIRANGGDMYVAPDLNRFTFLIFESRFLCNTALQRWTPRLEKEPPAAAYAISVYYFRRGYPERVKMISSPEVAKEILRLAGEDCFESDEHIIWKQVTT
jgi:hypothetical protein